MTDFATRADGTKLYFGDGGAGAVKAAKTHGATTAELVFTAKTAGTTGNSTTVAIVNPGGTAALSVSVTGAAITINAGTSSGSIISTANDVIAKIAQSAAASALVDVTTGGTGLGVVAALAAANLTGGTNSAEVFSLIKGLVGFDFDDRTHEDIDARTLDEPTNYMTNLTEGPGSASGEIQMSLTDAVHVALKAAYLNGVTHNFRIEHYDATIQQFSAQVKSFPRGKYQLGGLIKGSFGLLLKSEPVVV